MPKPGEGFDLLALIDWIAYDDGEEEHERTTGMMTHMMEEVARMGVRRRREGRRGAAERAEALEVPAVKPKKKKKK